MSAPHDPKRRRFLALVATSIALPAIGCSGADGSSPEQFGDVPAGKVSALAVGTLQIVPGAPACIGRDGGGIYAMTLTCTHQGCDMRTDGTVAATGIECDCHGSRFDANGAVVNGPANAPLRHFSVSADASGNLTIHGGSEVDPATRLTV